MVGTPLTFGVESAVAGQCDASDLGIPGLSVQLLLVFVVDVGAERPKEVAKVGRVSHNRNVALGSGGQPLEQINPSADAARRRLALRRPADVLLLRKPERVKIDRFTSGLVQGANLANNLRPCSAFVTRVLHRAVELCELNG